MQGVYILEPHIYRFTLKEICIMATCRLNIIYKALFVGVCLLLFLLYSW